MHDTERAAILERFDRIRERSRAFFRAIDDATYASRPIDLRHPFAFYEGHIPAFNVITLLRRGLGKPPVDEPLETLFARGIDPSSTDEVRQDVAWPSRAEIVAYAGAADRAVRDALANARLEDDSHPLLKNAEAVYCILEHEEMHHETLRYMRHNLPLASERIVLDQAAVGSKPLHRDCAWVEIRRGTAALGAARGAIRFGWDNEFGAQSIDVPPFEIQTHPVTNEEFLDFVEAGGYANQSLWSAEGWAWRTAAGVEHPHFWFSKGGVKFWRGRDGLTTLGPGWPVWVTHAEASAYARWSGARLPSEAEYHRAAYGTATGGERAYPWGDEEPDVTRGSFEIDRDDPVDVTAHPRGASAWGIEDLAGNGWEWTSTVFAPFPGFAPMPSYPQYSADFYDGAHFVMKGASPATDRTLMRRSFRNWFRGNYPYVFAKFRLARGAKS